jgi:hypothetical protein
MTKFRGRINLRKFQMVNKTEVFSKIGHKSVPRSAFNLSYEKKFTMDMGLLYPILHEEAVPGDIWEIGNSSVIRFQPLIAPILHQVKVRTYYFFVPYRILDEDWEEFITRGETGNSVVTLPLFNPAGFGANETASRAIGSLWDYLGFPTAMTPPPEACPIDYPRRAYYKIWNEFFRDQNLQTEVDETALVEYELKRRNWLKDYFTSALPFQQRGTPPALPIFGTATTDFSVPYVNSVSYDSRSQLVPMMSGNGLPANTDGLGWAIPSVSETPMSAETIDAYNDTGLEARFNNMLSDNNTVNISSLSSVDIADLRLASQLQVWMERNARAGARYTEFLRAHYGVTPTDDRLQRPEFLGGTSNDVIISEVLQTSSASGQPTPQGNLAGHGISVNGNFVDKYRVEEFGIIMGIMCVTPDPSYQDGINRQWLRRTTYDYYTPEFANLSEQEIKNAEITTRTVAQDPDGSINNAVFGYTGIFNEMRYKPNMVCGQMRDTFDYWHLGRQFDNTSPPSLNSDFVECNPRKDIFAVPSEPGLVCSFGNNLNVLRPMPIMAEPASLLR